MRKPEWITFTGLDSRTDMARVMQLSARYPIEWGVLFSPKRMGADNRYPGHNTLDYITEHPLRLAAHLCGGYARRALLLDRAEELLDSLQSFQRVQLNYVPDPTQWPLLADQHASNGLPLGHKEAARFSALIRKPVIVQHRTLTWPDAGKLDFLFDKSGGKGQAPANWPAHPGGERVVGYAGGFSPDNVAEQLSRINSTGPYWIDMEGNVRTEDDWLSLDKVERVCEAVYQSHE